MNVDAETRQIGEWVVKQRLPDGPGPHPVLLLLHGWTGDENSMGIFASRLPKEALLIAPRGLHSSNLGGYGWHPDRARGWPQVEDFRPSVDALLGLLVPENFPSANFSDLRLTGFSQGAALTYTFALLHPGMVRALAGMAGFLPEGAADLAQARPLEGKPVFVTHGARDEMVPVGRARQAVEILEQAGARVSYCEDDVGHKLSANCFRGLETFFQNN